MGSVEHIFIAADEGGPIESKREVRAVADFGLEGDRNAKAGASPGSQLTLIEGEVIDAWNAQGGPPLAPQDPRRNLVTRGVRLNELVGRRFRMGDIEAEGVRLCEPCATFQARTHPGIARFFTHKGGLRARLVRGGTLRVGDQLVDCT